MPPWPTRILSPTTSCPTEPSSGTDTDTTLATNLYEVPSLRSPSLYYNPARANHSRSNHARSFSHPFPSMLSDGGIRPPAAPYKESSIPGVNTQENRITRQSMHNVREPSSNKSPTKSKAVAKDDGLRTGNCLTCDSNVRWPKHLDVYRCTNCLMINDVKPAGKDTISSASGPKQELSVTRKALPLTVERTRDLAEQCVSTYLRNKADELNGITGSQRHHGPGVEVHQDERALRLIDRRTQQERLVGYVPGGQEPSLNAKSYPPATKMTVPTRPKTRERKDSPDEARPAWKQIFAPLEEYLIASLQDCSRLNAAFGLNRPAPVRASSESTNAGRIPQREKISFDEDVAFEFDAKTLLLGDIGENGLWWTGERQSSHSKVRKEENIDKKPARLDWTAIYAWYDIVLMCGIDWRYHLSKMATESRLALTGHEDEIDDVVSQGRYHVQRTLLKGIETLLRRPGRPLQTAEDVTFLVILLANPLLYPSSSRNTNRPGNDSNSDVCRTKRANASANKTQGVANGHHSGIIKRILGLMANLPLICHQALISWFSRVSETQFRNFVELVGGFVSYRLTRQKARSTSQNIDVTAGLIPDLSGPGSGTSAHLYAAIGESVKAPKKEKAEKEQAYRDDWQVKVAAKVMSLLFATNCNTRTTRYEPRKSHEQALVSPTQQKSRRHSQLLPTNFFYNTRLDYVDLIGDFEAWESRRGKFSFCQYPMFLSIWAKIRILEHDTRRQMEIKARDAFFTSIMKGKAVSQYLVFKVRRDCLVEDSLRNVSEVVGGNSEEIKKGLRIEFVGEEGVDAGGLRKEWFLLLTREVFDPEHGLFIYDSDSNYCYFNPFSFETSDQFFLIGVLLGLAIYNSTILDISLPPFAFRKLLASAPNYTGPSTTAMRPPTQYSLADLAEYRPSLARGLQQLLDHEGNDVEEVFCRDFVVEVERYGQITQVPLCSGGEKKAVTNANRKEFVDLYIHWLLDTSVARQYEPFKRGFFSVCGGNALSLFRPEEIELLIRGSDEALDTASIQGVAAYENCSSDDNFVQWFWEIFVSAAPKYQRQILTFITGSDRIPAMGATSLFIKIVRLGNDATRYPVARTCFNILGLWPYTSKEDLAAKLWRAVQESEGFGLK